MKIEEIYWTQLNLNGFCLINFSSFKYNLTLFNLHKGVLSYHKSRILKK